MLQTKLEIINGFRKLFRVVSTLTKTDDEVENFIVNLAKLFYNWNGEKNVTVVNMLYGTVTV